MRERFEIVEPIGSSGGAATFLARDGTTDDVVVLKELTLGRAESWKDVELFERETAVLRQLAHPAIPRYVAAFRGEPDAAIAFYLVQERIEGEPLSQAVERGAIPAERVAVILTELLEVLEYLHAFTPPVLHRDIKPANIVLRANGSVALVDFGAVQIDTFETMGGTTIVGTPGYMPPEQLVGKAVPASDLYALGATAIHLLTGIAPCDLPLERMKLRWRDRAEATPALCDLVDRMVEPRLADRVASAAQARGLLRMGGSAPLIVSKVRPVATLPRSSRVTIERFPERRRIRMPAMRRFPWRAETVVIASLIALVLMGTVTLLFHMALGWGWPVTLSILGATGTAIGGLGTVLASPEARKAELILDSEHGFSVRARDTDWEVVSGPLSDVVGPARGPGRTFVLAAGARTYVLGECEDNEQDWLEYEVVSFLRAHAPGETG